jgi:hypothetical protein
MVSKIYKIIEATESYFTEIELLNILCGLYWRIPGNMAEVKEYFTTKVDNKIKWVVDFLGLQQNLWVKNNFHRPLSILRSSLLRRTDAQDTECAEKGRV